MQGGAYGEHQLVAVTPGGERRAIDHPWFQVTLEPGSGATLELEIRRYVNQPMLSFPWKSVNWRQRGPGAMGSRVWRTPVAAKTAAAIAGAVSVMGDSPAPAGGTSRRSISSTSISGTSLKRGMR